MNRVWGGGVRFMTALLRLPRGNEKVAWRVREWGGMSLGSIS